jgi:S-methylmethionine-dependent homocysteine/selenocysteine methylase
MSTTPSQNQLTARLTRGEIVLLDGAMGTELERRGVPTKLPLWSAQALVSAPDRVREVHEEYVRAGAEILTANTFRTTPRSLRSAGMDGQADRLTELAITLCREARARAGLDREVSIAGSMAPLEDCYRPDLAPPAGAMMEEHGDQAARLKRAGAEFYWLKR